MCRCRSSATCAACLEKKRERKEAQLQGLQVDVDTRLAELWAVTWQEGNPLRAVVDDEETRGTLAAAFRAAYGLGYRDALREVDDGRRGELASSNGYVLRK